MKQGNACHTDLSGVMGNSQNVGYHPMTVTFGDCRFMVPVECFKADGTLKKSAVRRLNQLKAVALLERAA